MKDKELLQAGSAGLASRLQTGDNWAYASIHSMYKVKLYYYVRRMLDDVADVEDIVSESFIALWQSRNKMRSDIHIRNFLFITARNRAINLLKSKRYNMNGFGELEIPDTSMTDILEMELAQVEMMSKISQAVSSLPAEYKRIFELFFEMERSAGEIAGILKTSPGTVRSQKKRALEMIRNWIKKNAPLLIIALGSLPGYFTVLKKIVPFVPR